MPIVVQHTPARLVGDLAVNAGQYATANQNTEIAQRANQLAFQQQQAQQQLQLRRDELAQHDADREAQYAHQDQLAAGRGQGQQDLERLKSADRLEQLAAQAEAQGATREHVQQLRDEAANLRQQDRLGSQQQVAGQQDATRRRGQDFQYDIGQQNVDQRYGAQQAADGRAQQTDQRLRELAAQRGANGQNDPEFRRWFAETRAMNQYVSGLRNEQRSLTATLSRNPYTMDPAQATQIKQRLAELQQELQQSEPVLHEKINNPRFGATTTTTSTPAAAIEPGGWGGDAPANMPADNTDYNANPFAGDGGGGEVSQLDYAPPADAGTDPGAIQQQMAQDVANLKSHGVPHEHIRAHLVNTYGDYLAPADEQQQQGQA